MGTEKISSIFFSYSWKDMPIAMRIYDDLVRSGLTVWRDQISGTYGFDFSMEIDEKIAECEGFLLIDSSNARSGKWVGEECKLFEKHGGINTKALAICMVEKESLVFELPDMLTNQRTIKYYDFSTRGVLYDNENKYQEEIIKLCAKFGVEYQGFSIDDEVKDFEDEISQADISSKRKSLILQQFKLNSERLNLNYPYVGIYAKALVQECEDHNIESSTPMFMYGLFMANTGDFFESEKIFKKATETFPYDTRCWRAFGGSLFSSGKYKEAAIAFKKALRLIKAMRDGNMEVFPKTEMVKYNADFHINTLQVTQNNLAACLFRLQEYEEALVLYHKIFEASEDFRPPELFLGISDCLEALSNYSSQKEILLNALYYYPSNPRFHEEIAQLYVKIDSYDKSVWHYNFLYEWGVQNIQTLTDFLIVLRGIEHKDFEMVSEDVISKLSFETARDKYNLGHIYYMKGKLKESKKYYNDSALDEPYYEELWS